MAFPPAEENLDVPSELIGEGNLFGGEVVAIGGDPIINTGHPIADQADFPFRLIDTGGPQENDGVKKDNAVDLDVIRSDDGLFRGGFDPADKMLAVRLPGVKELNRLCKFLTGHRCDFISCRLQPLDSKSILILPR